MYEDSVDFVEQFTAACLRSYYLLPPQFFGIILEGLSTFPPPLWSINVTVCGKHSPDLCSVSLCEDSCQRAAGRLRCKQGRKPWECSCVKDLLFVVNWLMQWDNIDGYTWYTWMDLFPHVQMSHDTFPTWTQCSQIQV